MPNSSRLEELFRGVYEGILDVELPDDRLTLAPGLEETFRELVGLVGDLLCIRDREAGLLTSVIEPPISESGGLSAEGRAS